MRKLGTLMIFILTFAVTSVQSQIQTQPNPPFNQQTSAEESLRFVADDLRKIAESVRELNKNIVEVYGRVLSTKGLVLTDSQQKLLVSFEILNRAEFRLGNLQKLRIELIEKQTTVQLQIGEIDNSSRAETIDRSIALIGTTNAEELRDKRRKLLIVQKNSLNNLLSEIQSTLLETDSELAQTKDLVRDLRSKLFPAIYRELPKLDENY